MKILILGLIFSMSAMANEYVQKSGTCVVTADEQDFFNPARKLPFSLTLSYSFSYLKETGALVATKFESSTESNNTTPQWAQDVVETIADQVVVSSTYGGSSSAEFAWSTDQMDALLHYLGSYRSQDVSCEFPATWYEVAIPGRQKQQVHIESDFGLSYHVYTACDFDRTSTPGQDQDQQPTPPTQDMAQVCTYHLETRAGNFIQAFSTRSRRMDWACNASKNKCFERAKEIPGTQHCHKNNTFL